VLEIEGGLGEDASGGEEIVKRGKAVRSGGLRGGDRDGGRGGHRDGLAYDSRTPPPPPAKVHKVFEVDTLGLDLMVARVDQSLREEGLVSSGGHSGRHVCQVRSVDCGPQLINSAAPTS
jgi:hypothetical protein